MSNLKKEIKEYFVRFPGDFFSTQFHDCTNEKELRKKARIHFDVKRLPNNLDIWINEYPNN